MASHSRRCVGVWMYGYVRFLCFFLDGVIVCVGVVGGGEFVVELFALPPSLVFFIY